MVLGESAIRREVGGRRVMAAQLKRLADMSTMPNISLRVLPFSAGLPLGQPFGQFVILNFGEAAKSNSGEPPVVYLEHATGELSLEKPTEFVSTLTRIRASSEPPWMIRRAGICFGGWQGSLQRD